MSILSDIPFIGKLIDDYGEKLVLQGVEALTGIDLSKEELTQEDKQKIMDSQIEIMKIDFEKLKEDIKNELAYEVDIESTKTVKGISEELEKVGLINALYSMIERKANEQIKTWFPSSNVEALILEEKEVTGW